MNKWTYWKLARMSNRIKRKERMIKTLKLWLREEKKSFDSILQKNI